MTNNQSKSTDGVVSQTIVTNLEAPRLNGISVIHFNKFLRLRKLYEKKVEEKNREPGVAVTATSYKASIDSKYLEMMVAAKWIDADSTDDISEAQLKKCVNDRATRTVDETQIDTIQSVIKDIKMSTTGDAEDRVWTLYAIYIEVLENAGFKDLHKTHPHISIKHIYRRIQPAQLKKRMRDIGQMKKSEKFDEKDFNAYMRELARQAKKLGEEQKLDVLNSSESESEGNTSPKSSKKNNKKNKKKRSKPEENDGNDDKDSDKKKQKTLPDCLNPKCSEKHWLNNCPITSKKERKSFLDEYKKNRKTNRDPKPGKGKTKDGEVGMLKRMVSDHSALFSGTFADGAVEALVLADQGADINLISTELFDSIIGTGGNFRVTKLVPPQAYKGVGSNASITCSKKIEADVHLRIRHGSSLLLRNVVWKVCDEEKSTNAIIGRPLLDSIGCSNKVMLQSIADAQNGEIDVSDNPNEEKATSHPKIQVLMEGSTYHSAGGIENDGLEEDDVYVDIGEDSEEDLIAELEKRIEDARKKGISEKGAARLRDILFKHKSTFE